MTAFQRLLSPSPPAGELCRSAAEDATVDFPTAEELRDARRPLASLLSKSEKAQQKVAPGSWQHAMLRDNVSALRLALALLNRESPGAGAFTRADMQQALQSLASVVGRAGKPQFAQGTSQHTLQRNRLRALRVAEALITAELHAEPGAAPDRRGVPAFPDS